jgi:cytoskeleton protein RodZ
VSVEETVNPQNPQTHGGLEAVGNRLATARRQQQLELKSVASQLHLAVEVVAALETGDRSVLPAMTFVRGYIKSYARLLGLDEKQILDLIPAGEGYQAAPLKAVGMRSPRRRQPIGKWLLRAMGVAALAAVMVYGVPLVERLWNRNAQTGQTGDENTLPLPADEHQGLQPMELPAPPEEAEAPAPEEAAVVPESEFDTGVQAPPLEAEAPPLEAEAPPLEAEAPPPAEVAQSVAQPAADTTGPALITLRFAEDSWVEMESHGRKLVVGTQTAGSERSVRAEPPIQILLGNAPGVEIEYRGKSVDLKRYRRGKVARLVLED